jgi:hypothetical protein
MCKKNSAILNSHAGARFSGHRIKACWLAYKLWAEYFHESSCANLRPFLILENLYTIRCGAEGPTRILYTARGRAGKRLARGHGNFGCGPFIVSVFGFSIFCPGFLVGPVFCFLRFSSLVLDSNFLQIKNLCFFRFSISTIFIF